MTIDHELLRWQHPYDPANATLWVRLLAANGWEVGAPNNPFSIVLRERLPSELPRPPFTLFVWTRAATQPPTPEGGTYESPEPTTTGWSLIHPEGEDPLWFSQRTYLGDSAPGAWSTPVRVEGRDGEDGAPGQDGQDGAPGQDGQDGAPGQDGKDGEDGAAGQDGASTLMAFGRFLNQPATPTQTVAPPSSSWSLDSENAPGNAIYPLWVTVGTRPVGSALWTWQKPFRFTPLDGEDGAPGQTGLSVAHLTIYRRAASAPNTPIGGTYNFDTKTLSGFTAGWSTTIPDGDNPLWASNATAAVPGPSGVSGTLSWSTPRQISRNGEPALSTVQLFVYKRSTNPTLAEFPSGGSYNFGTKTFTTPTSPLGWSATIPDDAALGFVFVSTALAAAIGNNGTDSALTWTQSRRLTDDMLLADGSVDASKIAPNAVTTAKIAANAVTAVKIAAGAIETDKLAANAVTAAKIAANAITAEKINVATLAAIQTNTGNLVVDGEVRSGSYTAGSVGWKIKSDGSAEFNELTLRKGIITPDDILLHDPSILLYNPNFTVPHGTLPNLAAGWGRWYYDISGSAEWIERGNFGPNYRTDANSPGMPGIGMRFRSFWSDNRWAFIRSANALKIPVLAGERFMARALCKNPGLRILIVFYGADGVWIGNAQIPGQIDTLLSPMYDRQEWGYLEFAFRVPENVRFLTYELHRGRNEDNGYAEGAPNESGASTNLNYACLCGGCLLHRMPGFIHPEALPRPEMPTLSQTFSGSITVARPSIPSGMTLRHTTDGSEVTEMSPVWFNGSLTFSVDTTLRVRFFDAAGFFGPEASANYTRVAEPPPAPLARPVGSFSETNLSLTINSISRPSGGGTTTHVSVNGGTAITSTAS
ncbi:MAG: hypothetical protein JJT96_17585, partial [Opitutales bacterium]|nr:hypothetical protein [Opitutales bacterium]